MEDLAKQLTEERYDLIIGNLRKKIPNFKTSGKIECLNLIMKKQFAEDIINGKKKMEYRNYSKHYFDRLYDKDVLDLLEEYCEDEYVQTVCEPFGIEPFFDPVKPVLAIKFHNYNDTWSLKVECKSNNFIALTDPNVQWMEDNYNDTEFSEIVEDLNKSGIDERPLVFYFELGEILERKNI